jgi:hypothetical protein
LKERDAEVNELQRQLEQAQNESDRLRQENEHLRQELKATGWHSHSASNSGKRKKRRKRPGRKAGQGQFTFRKSPAGAAASEPPVEVPVTITQCPCCGGELRWERTDPVTVTDMPEQPQPEVKRCAGASGADSGCADNIRTWRRINMGRRRIGSARA